MSKAIFGAITMCLSVSAVGCAVPTPPWQIPAKGAALTATDIQRLAGKTCWGWFDRGNDYEFARGAIFIVFAPNAQGGQLWRKWGREAQLSPRSDTPEGYEDMGSLVPTLSDTGTEITFKGDKAPFNWFIQPLNKFDYTTRAVGSSNGSNGATGKISCR